MTYKYCVAHQSCLSNAEETKAELLHTSLSPHLSSCSSQIITNLAWELLHSLLTPSITAETSPLLSLRKLSLSLLLCNLLLCPISWVSLFPSSPDFHGTLLKQEIKTKFLNSKHKCMPVIFQAETLFLLKREWQKDNFEQNDFRQWARIFDLIWFPVTSKRNGWFGTTAFGTAQNIFDHVCKQVQEAGQFSFISSQINTHQIY